MRPNYFPVLDSGNVGRRWSRQESLSSWRFCSRWEWSFLAHRILKIRILNWPFWLAALESVCVTGRYISAINFRTLKVEISEKRGGQHLWKDSSRNGCRISGQELKDVIGRRLSSDLVYWSLESLTKRKTKYYSINSDAYIVWAFTMCHPP